MYEYECCEGDFYASFILWSFIRCQTYCFCSLIRLAKQQTTTIPLKWNLCQPLEEVGFLSEESVTTHRSIAGQQLPQRWQPQRQRSTKLSPWLSWDSPGGVSGIFTKKICVTNSPSTVSLDNTIQMMSFDHAIKADSLRRLKRYAHNLCASFKSGSPSGY